MTCAGRSARGTQLHAYGAEALDEPRVVTHERLGVSAGRASPAAALDAPPLYDS